MLVNFNFLKVLFISLFVSVVFNLHSNNSTDKSDKNNLSRFDTIDIQHYDIHLDIIDFAKKTIIGYTEITLSSKVNTLNNVSFDLYKLTIDSISIDGISITTYNYNNTLLQIPLLNTINANETIKVKISYHGTPQTDPSSMGGWYFSGDYAYNIGVGIEFNPHSIGRIWYPCYDDFRSRATYDYYITTDNTHNAVCGGMLLSTTTNTNKTITHHWQLTSPIPSYLSSVAVSDYKAVKDTVKGALGTIPIMTYITKDVDSANVKSFLKNLKPIFRFYEKQFGPYRWQRIGYTGVPETFGAMEHATNVGFPNLMFLLGLSYEWVYAHELSHSWFGNLITCASEADIWLNEGWAKFSEIYYREGIYGKKNYKDNIRENHRDVLQNVAKDDGGPFRALYGMPFDYTYGQTTYKKGADVVHTLRNYIGDDMFFNTVRKHTNDNAFKSMTTAEVMKFFTDNSGLKMDDFFNAWVYGPGFPHFSIDSFRVVNGDKAEVFVRQRLKGATSFANSNRIEITFMTNDWQSYTDTIVFSGEFGSKTFTLPFTPDIVMIDKEEKISDATTDNYATIKASGTYVFPKTFFSLITSQINDSAFVRVEHNWIAPDKNKKPITDITRLSEERYWKIDGNFPADFKATGSFFFSRTTDATNGNLDNKLLKTAKSIDSLRLLYRKNTSDDWKPVSFTKTTGAANSGNLITTDNLQAGEYCFGIGKPYVAVNEINSNNEALKIYPNPSSTNFTLDYNLSENAILKIFSLTGEKLAEFSIVKGHNLMKWQPADLKQGSYIFTLYSNDNKVISTQNALFVR